MQQDAALTQHYERLGRFIYGFQRHTDPDALRALPPSHSMATRGAALAARFEGAIAASRYDSGTGQPDAVSEAAFSAILEEAQAFAGEIGWRYGIPTS
jgi:hypothetical protein